MSSSFDDTVTSAVTDGVAATIAAQPDDPVDYLGRFLLKFVARQEAEADVSRAACAHSRFSAAFVQGLSPNARQSCGRSAMPESMLGGGQANRHLAPAASSLHPRPACCNCHILRLVSAARRRRRLKQRVRSARPSSHGHARNKRRKKPPHAKPRPSEHQRHLKWKRSLQGHRLWTARR